MNGDIKVLAHGTREAPLVNAPTFGHRIGTPKVELALASADPFEVSFTAPVDVVTAFFSTYVGEGAYGSDRADDFRSLPHHFQFHPAGQPVFARAFGPTGGLLQVNLAPEIRRSLDYDFGGRAASSIDYVGLNLPSPRGFGLVRMAVRLLLAKHKPDSLTIESVGLMILTESLRAILKEPDQSSDPYSALDRGRLFQVLDLIEAELDQDISLQSLADAAGLSMFHFAKAFKSALGLPPRQYVIERRLARARDLLSATALPLADIAYAVGFSSQSHMTAAFSARLGVTPAGYRDAVAA